MVFPSVNGKKPYSPRKFPSNSLLRLVRIDRAKFPLHGYVEGTVKIKENLTVSQGGEVKAEVTAKSVQVSGRVSGSIESTDKVDVAPTGVVNGNIKSPRFIVSQGGVLNGNIQMPMPEGGQASKA